MTLVEFYNLLKKIDIPVFHYEAADAIVPYIVYQEYAANYEIASNKPYSKNLSVEVVHFTKLEFDPTFDLLEKTLLENDIFFSVSITFDSDEKVIQSQLEVNLLQEIERL